MPVVPWETVMPVVPVAPVAPVTRYLVSYQSCSGEWYSEEFTDLADARECYESYALADFAENTDSGEWTIVDYK